MRAVLHPFSWAMIKSVLADGRGAALLSSPLYRELCFFCKPESQADAALLLGACKLLVAHRDSRGEQAPAISHMRSLQRLHKISKSAVILQDSCNR